MQVVATNRSEVPRGDAAVRLAQLLSKEAAACHVGARLDAVQHSRGTAYTPHYGGRHSGQQVWLGPSLHATCLLYAWVVGS